VADLHVLEDLCQRERRRSGRPQRLEARADEQYATQQREPPVELDYRADVARVAVAEVVVDLLVELVELLADRLDLVGREAVQGVLDLGVHLGSFHNSISTGPRAR